ncbi:MULTISPECIES: hypothetical protein [unclassified Candidatus Frackibacter]|uniref:hypothetical protein n=1 Tax=unclassified Candidatus Frackibacter TaxID=2648818 RepID=UPI0008C982AE|nr:MULTISPECIES: hypothetical protein [unclassified Candidatus Frackibacter]SEM81625.1 hypothetical protein SAMN04488698_11836 [Candidatus Frackibacter sp. WG12]SFL72370.1 hypothetical protein SAMN04488699_11114 [Candidatus Frackibacter sp. WG13]
MKRNFTIIRIILIVLISILLTQNTLARGLDLQGYLRWKSDYRKNKDGASDYNAYSDYSLELGKAGVLFIPQIGYYDFGLNYRDYLYKSEGLEPKVTGYHLNTDLFPMSPMSLGLNTSKSKREYKTDKITSPVDTISKSSSVSLSSPLPFGLRFQTELKKKQNFDVKKAKINDKNYEYDLSLNKNLSFGEYRDTAFLNTKITGKYNKMFTKDLINNKTKNKFINRYISINNYFHKDWFSLSDIDGVYYITDRKKKRNIGYNLRTKWQPLKYLETQVSHKKRIEKEEIEEDSYIFEDSNTESTVAFTATPYPILSFNGEINKIDSKKRAGLASNDLIIELGFDTSYWKEAPIEFDISSTSQETFDQINNLRINRQENVELSLESNLNFKDINSKVNFSNNSNKEFETGYKVFEKQNTSLSLEDNLYDIESILKISNSTQKRFNKNYKISSQQQTSLSLDLDKEFVNLYFGNFTLESSYNQNIKWKKEIKDEVIKNRRTDVTQKFSAELNYQRYLTKNLYFNGRTEYDSNLKDFEYKPNYDLDLLYNPTYSDLKFKLGVEGYHEDEEDNIGEKVKNYRQWEGEISYSKGWSQLSMNLWQDNDFVADKWDRSINLNVRYRYRSIVLKLDVSWRETGGNTYNPGDTLEVTTGITRYF